jgi:hypothetical protein
VDGALSSPRELVVDDDVDVRESLERGLRLRCFDFAAETNVADVFIGHLRHQLESTDAPNLLLLPTVPGVGLPSGAR